MPEERQSRTGSAGAQFHFIQNKKMKKILESCRKQGAAAALKNILRGIAGQQAEPSKIAKEWTAYMSWLQYANAGMLKRGNAYCMDHAVKNLPSSSPIVEIGSFCGLSTNMITHMKERHGVRNSLITCDRWLFEGAEQRGMLGASSTVSHAEYREFVKESYIRNIKMFSRYDLPYTVELFSDEFFKAWTAGERMKDVLEREITLGGPISFCYIDGNHSYDFAKRDFENTDRYLESGGFLLFDDSGDGSKWQVCRVVQEVVSTGRYELLDKSPNYFFRKK